MTVRDGSSDFFMPAALQAAGRLCVCDQGRGKTDGRLLRAPCQGILPAELACVHCCWHYVMERYAKLDISRI
jgi:hypothetical protein